jgi:cob(I)alamin adenosyltransferase
MTDRLTRIYTRTGDKGTTGLADGRRVEKYHPRIEALGDIDELNSSLGVLIADLAPGDPMLDVLPPLQHDLFDMGGELAMVEAQYWVLDAAAVSTLEQQLDSLNADLPALREFINNGGNRPSALCQQSRRLCRSAQRLLVELAKAEAVNPHALV